MKTHLLNKAKISVSLFAFALIGFGAQAQTSVFDIIAGSPAHTTLEQAIIDAGLQSTLDDQNSEFTVFAPDDAAFTAFFNETGLSAGDLGSADLLYHVLDVEVQSTGITNGDTPTPLNTANTLKLTVDGPSVYVNQSMVTTPNLTADNGVVHSMDAVLLPTETVADVAIDSPNHTTLVAAVVEARLLPALTDPFSSLTVFAPDDNAFLDALNELNISAGDLLADPNLDQILLYHVLGTEVLAGDLNNGDVAVALNTSNTLKVTIDGMDVFINQAQVSTPDVTVGNGTVHVLDAVVFANETVADVAIDSPDHTTLVAAVVEARLLPALTDPFSEYTLFAPDDAAFTQFLNDEGITANDLLNSPDLADILLYHTLGMEVLSGDLANGPATTLNGDDVVVDLSNGVMINSSNVTTADLDVDNGVVHVLDYPLDPSVASINELNLEAIEVYPNPAENILNVKDMNGATYSIVNMSGQTVLNGTINSTSIEINSLEEGTYFINLNDENQVYRSRFVKL